MDFWETIEELRKRKGVSQRDLESALGFSNGSYSKWKNSKPTTERLQKLADYFGVSIEYLTTGKETAGIDFGNTYTMLSDREQRFLNSFRLLSGEMQDRYLDLIESNVKESQQKP